MNLPADRSTPTSAPPLPPSLREAVRSPRRRRPTGEPPPLPYHLQTSGVGWLIAAGVAPPVLLVRSFGNGAGLLVQQRVHGRDLTDLGGERLDQTRLADLWQQAASLRAARIAHRDLGLSSVMVDEDGCVWLVDFDRAEAAASQVLLDRDLTTLLAALDGVADAALVRATAEQALGQDTVGRVLPPAASTTAASMRHGPTAGAAAPAPDCGRQSAGS
jgi:hypothetical protein